ncbi:hypothetical protein O3P69_010134, partial [Scylla paramamosain]
EFCLCHPRHSPCTTETPPAGAACRGTIVHAAASSRVKVHGRGPQDSVLGPLLFLTDTKDTTRILIPPRQTPVLAEDCHGRAPASARRLRHTQCTQDRLAGWCTNGRSIEAVKESLETMCMACQL